MIDEVVVTFNGRVIFRGPRLAVQISNTSSFTTSYGTNWVDPKVPYYRARHEARWEQELQEIREELKRYTRLAIIPPPIDVESSAISLEELRAAWLPPNAHVGPRKRRRRRAPRQVRPVRARPGMRH